MKKTLIISCSTVLLVILFISFKSHFLSTPTKINGVSFVAPPREITADQMSSMKTVGAEWVAIIPYAFSGTNKPEVNFDYPRQWWGEKREGAAQTIKFAQKLGMKVMLKPHVWVRGQGWPGDYDLNTEEDWKTWEKSYSKYIMSFARLADSLDVSMVCIGTEFRHAAVKRPNFWRKLIQDVRNIYSGKLTYAANWDNYDKVTFWNELDYIGIDGYFPLTDSKTPKVSELNAAWQKVVPPLKKISEKYSLSILFTEYGYESIDYTTFGHWNYQKDTLSVNLTAQSNAYESFYQSIWNEPWFSGGFLWKWHAYDQRYGGPQCKRYTPQNKPVENVIKKWYTDTKSQP